MWFCQYPPGTYTLGVTKAACDAWGGRGRWRLSADDCFGCSFCDTLGGGVTLQLQQFEFAAGGTVSQGGVFNIQTTTQTSGCTAVVTGYFTPLTGGAQTPASCTMTLQSDSSSPSGYSIRCVWSPSQVYGCTLTPTCIQAHRRHSRIHATIATATPRAALIHPTRRKVTLGPITKPQRHHAHRRTRNGTRQADTRLAGRQKKVQLSGLQKKMDVGALLDANPSRNSQPASKSADAAKAVAASPNGGYSSGSGKLVDQAIKNAEAASD